MTPSQNAKYFVTLLSAIFTLAGCREQSQSEPGPPPSAQSSITPTPLSPSTQIPPAATPPPIPKLSQPAKCPPEMVSIPSEIPYCIDRWEAVIEDKITGRRLSPYYPPVPTSAVKIRDTWETERLKVGSPTARAVPLPPLPAWQLSGDVVPMAVSRPGEIPHGYLSGVVARQVCENSGKRLCTQKEWVRACRGSANQPFPYGEKYKSGSCNIFRTAHPAFVLHDDVTTGHLDPRLNQVQDTTGPLLRTTGETKACASLWGNDAVYDMVGNLDEWVDDKGGMFLGGFFSRAKKDGCESVVKSHPANYWDYSLGVRCCLSPNTR